MAGAENIYRAKSKRSVPPELCATNNWTILYSSAFVLLYIHLFARRDDLPLCRIGLPACPLRSLCAASLITVQPPRLARDTAPTLVCGLPLCIPFDAPRDDFVGQVVNLRPIVNRPAGSTHKFRRCPGAVCGLPLCNTIHSIHRAPRRFPLCQACGAQPCTTMHTIHRAPRRFPLCQACGAQLCGAGCQPAADC